MGDKPTRRRAATRPAGPRTTLTRGGQTVIVLALALVASAGLFGIEELYAVAAAAGALVCGSGLWVSLRRWRLTTARQLRPARVSAGGEARVELVVANSSATQSPVVTARDPFDGGRRWAEFTVAPLAPGETARAAYRLPTARRGRYVVGPLRLELSDPFGLFSRACPGANSSIITVHPRVVAVRPPPTSTGSDRRDAAGTAVVGRAGDEFYGVREYRPGDDLRRVHWPSTARTDELMIRQDEISWSGRLTVVTDLRASSHLGESLETALSVAASVAASGCGGQLRVRLATTGGTDTGFGAGANHLSTILDELAAAAPHLDRQGAGLLALADRAGPGGAVVVVTTTATGPEQLAGVAHLVAALDLTVVVVELGRGLDMVPPGTGVAGARMVRVPTFEGFAEAWNRALGQAWTRSGSR